MGSRRRSHSASRTLDETVNLVGRIGASLRISGRKKNRTGEKSQDHFLPTTKKLLTLASASLDSGPLTSRDLRLSQSHSVTNSPRLSRFRPLGEHISCPVTPEFQRQIFLKDGATQLTSMSTLMTHHRHFFLFDDVLLVSKQKGPNSYKFKEKISLDKIWIASNNCTHSFLIGWPHCNYVAHFSSEKEKNEWLEELSTNIKKKLVRAFTTVAVVVKVDSRNQILRHEIENGSTASEILSQLVTKLNLGSDTNLFELFIEINGSTRPLHGIENIYGILKDYIGKIGLNLSQVPHVDTCPLVECRLIIQTSQSPAPVNSLVNQMKKAILSRMESKKLFGRKLEGSMPPQPVLTMIDYLSMHAHNTEGIFRKSPKQSTVRKLKDLLDHGQVPNFHEFSPHVTASLLKDYLRSIPGQLLISGNYQMWMEICAQSDDDVKIKRCKNLLQFLPPSNIILLRCILRLLRTVSNEPQSKMNTKSLAVCIAPSLLENPVASIEDSVKKVPELAAFLIVKAPLLFENFEEDCVLIPNSQLYNSTDSGLSFDLHHDQAKGVTDIASSPNSLQFDSSYSDDSNMDMDNERKTTNFLRCASLNFDTTPEVSPPLSPWLRRPKNFQHDNKVKEILYSGNSKKVVHRKEYSSESTTTLMASELEELRGSRITSLNSPPPSTTMIRPPDDASRSPTLLPTFSPSIPSSPLIPRNLSPWSASNRSPSISRSPIQYPTVVSRSTSSYITPPTSRLPRTCHLLDNNKTTLINKSSAAAKPPIPHRPSLKALRKPTEEIILGQEVNWSVLEIRSRFQKEDLKPAHIDTVYARLDLIKRNES